jgi:hypothetical protein
MTGLNVLADLVIGLLLRLGIPLGLMSVMVWVVHSLDQHWQSNRRSKTQVMASNPGCWKIFGCPEEKSQQCLARKNKDVPCWHLFRDENGQLQQRCLACKIFRDAKVPVLT